MKFVVYRGGKKITVKNIWLSEMENVKQLMNDFPTGELAMEDLQSYNMKITSTRGVLDFDEDGVDDDIAEEMYEGIEWRQETVN